MNPQKPCIRLKILKKTIRKIKITDKSAVKNVIIYQTDNFAFDYKKEAR